jgi:hypothetical protein
MGTMKGDAARRELVELNNRFRDRKLASPSFYSQLMQAGFAYAACVLVSLVPDGANTFIGKVIRQDGRVFEFDVDLDSPQFTTWRDVTDEFREGLKTGRIKPWSAEKMAFDEYLRTHGEQ